MKVELHITDDAGMKAMLIVESIADEGVDLNQVLEDALFYCGRCRKILFNSLASQDPHICNLCFVDRMEEEIEKADAARRSKQEEIGVYNPGCIDNPEDIDDGNEDK